MEKREVIQPNDKVKQMDKSQKVKILVLGTYLLLIVISLLWFEALMLLVFLITVFMIYSYFSRYLTLRQRHYERNNIGSKEEFSDSQKWDEHVAKTAMRRSRGV